MITSPLMIYPAPIKQLQTPDYLKLSPFIHNTTLKCSHNFIIFFFILIKIMAKPALQQPPDFDSAKLYLWVKALEGKVNNLLREVDLLKNDFINKNSQLKKDLKIFNEEFMEYQHEQQKTSEKMDLII